VEATTARILRLVGGRRPGAEPTHARGAPVVADIERDQTLGEWLQEWLDRCVARGLRASTVASYRTMVRLHVQSSALWERALDEVSAADLNGLYSRLLRSGRLHAAGGLSPRTVRYVHALLSKAFSDAVRVGLLTANPAVAADPPSARSARSRVPAVWSPG